MTAATPDDLSLAVSHFIDKGCDWKAAPLGGGLVNQTWLITAGNEQFVLQRLSSAAFRNPLDIVANLDTTRQFIARSDRSARSWRLPAIRPAVSGQLLVFIDGSPWRAQEYIRNSHTLTRLETANQAGSVGRTLGQFHCILGELDCSNMHRIIDDFHHTGHYWQVLTQAREQYAQRHIPRHLWDFLEQRRDSLFILDQAAATGVLRPTVTHGDPKLANFLFAASGQVSALIDLDTLQPGLLLHDLGDCLRSCCRSSPAVFDLQHAEALIHGYLEANGHNLDEQQTNLIPEALRILPMELLMRYLTDHLQGNRYFHTTHDGQNLQRAEVYRQLTESIESQSDRFRQLINSIR